MVEKFTNRSPRHEGIAKIQNNRGVLNITQSLGLAIVK